MSKVSDPKEILKFWFSDEARPLWFNSTPAFDDALRARFLDTYWAAARGELDSWTETAEGAVALVIVLDQFPLNMFRGEAESFASEANAREITYKALEKGFDEQVPDEQKAFLYLPLMHSEDLADQDQSVACFEKAGLEENLKWARHHRELIRRFGRFPHRNAVLARPSTPEEITYLGSEEAFLG